MDSHNRLGEPNNSCGLAYDIVPGMTWKFLPEDRADWYRFRLAEAADVRVHLNNFVPLKGQMAIYRGESCGTAGFLVNDGDDSAQRTLDLGLQPAGQFFIFVANDGFLNQTEFYTLLVETE